MRVRESHLETLRRGGVSAAYVERFSGEGEVVEVERSKKHGWVSVLVRFDAGHSGAYGEEDLERVPVKRARRRKP